MPSSSAQNDPLARMPDDEQRFSPPKPQLTWTGVGLATIFWALYTVLYGLLIARGEDIPLAWALPSQFIANVFMALYSVPVWWLNVRKMDPVHWGWVLLVHVGIAPLYAWISLESYILFFDAGLGANLRRMLADRYQWIFFSNVTVYVAQFAVYHLVRNVQQLRAREQQATELLARARKQQLAALKAQVNPHFLFNTLNSISATLKQDPDQAREMIAKLAGMMRYAFDSASRSLVPLRNEVEFVRQYLDLEAHRFSDRLEARVTINADEGALETSVPPMVLQPLVENALQHGIAPSESGGTVAVRVADTNERLEVHVEDTGTGPSVEDPLSEADGGTGLTNTSTRLEHTYGPEAALHTAPNEPSGFAVWFSIPRDGTAASE